MTTDFGLAHLDPLKPSFVLVLRWHLPYLRIPHPTLASPIKIHATLGPPTSGPEAPGYLLLEPKSSDSGVRFQYWLGTVWESEPTFRLW